MIGRFLPKRTNPSGNKAIWFSSAFTLVELLVVIAIIGVLVALLMPAIQAAREAARRATCQSNLRQIAMGVEAYHEIYRRYPPGEFLGNSGVGKNSRAWSWLARVLPYIEQGTVYDNGKVGEVKLSKSKAAPAVILLFLCPSDGSGYSPRKNAGNLPGFAVGQTNYKGVMGANWGMDATQKKNKRIRTKWPNPGTNGAWDGPNNGDGLMFRSDINVRRDHATVTDGLSNTFMIGEALPKYDRWCSWPYSNNAYSTCAIPLNVNRILGRKYDPNVPPHLKLEILRAGVSIEP